MSDNSDIKDDFSRGVVESSFTAEMMAGISDEISTLSSSVSTSITLFETLCRGISLTLGGNEDRGISMNVFGLVSVWSSSMTGLKANASSLASTGGDSDRILGENDDEEVEDGDDCDMID